MGLTFQEEIAHRAALMEIRLERKRALREMFDGTKLIRKSLADDAKEAFKAAKKAKKAIENVPGISVPDLNNPFGNLNLNLLKGIDLKKLIKIKLPGLNVPDWDLDLIPDINIGDIPGINLPDILPNLRGILKHLDLLPDISLRLLAWQIGVKFPHIQLPSVAFDLSNIFKFSLPDIFPGIKLAYPDFFDIDISVDLPNWSIPDVSLPNMVPPINIDLPTIDLPSLEIPGLDIPNLLKIPGFSKVLGLLVELFDVVDLPDVIGELGLDFIQDFISSALPIIQQVKSGSKAANSWRKAARDLHKAVRTHKKHRKFVLPGDARNAVDALRTLLKQSSAEHATRATIETAQFAVSTAGLFADLGGATGPATSAAAACAKMCQKIVLFAMEYNQMKKINHILKTTSGETLTSDLFEVSPLLGCYFLANNTTSNVLNVLCKDILTDNWMTDAERNKKKHLDPLIKDSQSFINKSRYVLQPIRQNKGMFVEKSTFAKLKARAALAFKKKFGRAPSNATISTHDYIGK